MGQQVLSSGRGTGVHIAHDDRELVVGDEPQLGVPAPFQVMRRRGIGCRHPVQVDDHAQLSFDCCLDCCLPSLLPCLLEDCSSFSSSSPESISESLSLAPSSAPDVFPFEPELVTSSMSSGMPCVWVSVRFRRPTASAKRR